jgi:hypothetical protein
MEDFLGEFKKASFYKRKSDQKHISDLAPVLEIVEKAAEGGAYDVDLKEELTDTQINALESLGFSVGTFDEEEDQYKEGFRSWLDWEDPEDE